MTISIETVCTHDDLADEIGGPTALANIIPADYAGASALPRTQVLAEVMRSLERRTPPIYDSDIGDPTDLKAVVMYGTLEKLYRLSMTTSDGVFAVQRKIYADRFNEELRGLMVKSGGADGQGRVAAFSFAMERR